MTKVNPLLYNGKDPLHPADALERVGFLLRFLSDSLLQEPPGEFQLSTEGRQGCHFFLNFLADTTSQIGDAINEKEKSRDIKERKREEDNPPGE